MKRKLKKIIPLILAVSLILGMIPAAALADNSTEVTASGTCGDNLTWELTSDGTLTISGTGEMEGYTTDGNAPWYSYVDEITTVIIGDDVTSIGNLAFYYCTSLTSITIPDSVTSIGNWAFYSCSSLTSITIPNSVTSIGNNICYNCTSLTTADFGNGLTSISSSAFYKCSSLTSITIPDSVTSIGADAFSGCSSLTSITIPNSVTSIGVRAFASCTSLTSITIPDSVTSISGESFYNCTSLTGIYVDSNNTAYTSLDGVLFNIEITGLICYPAGKPDTHYTIPSSVTGIWTYGFCNCSNLVSIEIPDSVTSIGDYAFYHCSGLASITIPEGVTRINEYTFGQCTSLTSITIPDSVTRIEKYAFYRCSGLTSVDLGESVTVIYREAFYGCSSLTYIIIPDSVISIAICAFYKCTRLTDVYYAGSEDDWEAISISYGNTYLTSATIHYNSTGPDEASTGDFNEAEITLSSYSFMYDGTEKEPEVTVVLDDEELTYGTDYYVYYLDNVEVGTATAVIYGTGDYDGEVDIEFEITNPSGTFSDGLSWILDVETGILTISGNGAMDDFNYESEAAPWYSVRSKITEAVIEEGITSIGDDAFYGCTNLVYVTISETVTSIGKNAFYGCSSLYSVTIPDGVTSVESGTFVGCGDLGYILIPESVTYIADDAFSSAENIYDVYYPGTEDEWNGIDGYDNYELSLADFYFESNGERLRVSVTSGSSSIILGTVTGGYVGCYIVGILSDDYTEFICTISDSDVISVDLGTFNSSYGQYFTVSAEAVGNTSLAFTNPETGQAGVVYLTVNLEESAYSLDTVPQMTIEEGKVTNFYNYEGLVVDDFAYTANYNSDGDIESYTVTMTVYNSLPIYAAVTTFDADGDISDFAVVDRFDTNTTSLWDTVKELADDISDLYYLCKNSLYYSGSTITKKTEVEVEVPAGGSIEISNSMQSVVPCYANLVWLLIETGMATYSLGTTVGDILSSEETKLTIINSVMKSLIEWDETNNPVTKKLKSSLKSAVNDVFKAGSVDYDNCTELVESFCDVLEETGIDLIETITDSILSVSGLGNLTVSTVESMLLSAIPTGNIVKLMFNIYEMEDVAIAWATFTDSIDFGDGIYIYAYSVDGSVYSNGVNVTLTEATAEDYDIVVHAYLVVDSSEVEITDTLDASSYEIYSITLYKNGEAIQADGDVTVKIPVSSSGTVSVYRVEDDGSLTEMNIVIEDGYAVFTTDHFSYYVVAYDDVSKEEIEPEEESEPEEETDSEEETESKGETEEETEPENETETEEETKESSDGDDSDDNSGNGDTEEGDSSDEEETSAPSDSDDDTENNNNSDESDDGDTDSSDDTLTEPPLDLEDSGDDDSSDDESTPAPLDPDNSTGDSDSDDGSTGNTDTDDDSSGDGGSGDADTGSGESSGTDSEDTSGEDADD